MLGKKELGELLKDCLNMTYINEMIERSYLLNSKLDSQDYTVDLRGTKWEDKGIYKVSKSTKKYAIYVSVDLYYFEAQSMNDTKGNIEVCLNDYDEIDMTAPSDLAYFIVYDVIDDKMARQKGISEFIYEITTFSGSYIPYFNLTQAIDYGRHYFYFNINETSILYMNTLKAFRDCMLYTNILSVYQDDLEDIVLRGLKINATRYIFNFNVCDKNNIDSIIKVINYFRNHNKHQGFDDMITFNFLISTDSYSDNSYLSEFHSMLKLHKQILSKHFKAGDFRININLGFPKKYGYFKVYIKDRLCAYNRVVDYVTNKIDIGAFYSWEC